MCILKINSVHIKICSSKNKHCGILQTDSIALEKKWHMRSCCGQMLEAIHVSSCSINFSLDKRVPCVMGESITHNFNALQFLPSTGLMRTSLAEGERQRKTLNTFIHSLMRRFKSYQFSCHLQMSSDLKQKETCAGQLDSLIF